MECNINDKCTKSVETALAAHTKRGNKINLKSRKRLTNLENQLLKNAITVGDQVMLLLTATQMVVVKKQTLHGRKRRRSLRQQW